MSRLLGGVIVVAALLTGLHLVIQHRLASSVDTGPALHRFERLAEEHLSRDVEIGDVRLRTLPRPGLELRRVRIAHLPGTTDPHVAAARSVLLEPRLAPLLLGRVDIQGVRLEGLDLHFSDEPGGSGPTLQNRMEAAVSLALPVRSVHLEDASVSYRDARGRMRLDAAGLELRARRRSSTAGWRLGIRFGARRINGRPPPPYPTVDSMEVRGRMTLEGSGSSIRLVPSSVRLGPARFTVRGEKNPDGGIRLVGQLQDLELESVADIPGEGRMSGRLSGHLAVVYPNDGSGVRASGGYRVRELSLDLHGRTLLKEGGGSGRLRGDTLFLDSLSAEVLEEPADIGGRLRLVAGVPYRLRFRGEPHVGPLLDLVGGPGTPRGEGRIRTRITATGTMSPDPLPRSFRGFLSPRGVRLVDTGIPAPLSLPRGRIRLNGRRAAAQSLPLLLGSRAFAFTGTASRLLDLVRVSGEAGRSGRPEVRGSLTGAALDLSLLSGGEPGRPPPSPVDLNLTVRLDTLRAGSFSARAVSARLRMGPEILTVGPARMKAWGGVVRPDLTLGLSVAGPTAFGIRVRLDSVRVGEPLELASGGRIPLPVGRASGRVEASGEVSPSLAPIRELLAGSAALVLSEGRLPSTAVTRTLARQTGLNGLESPRFSELRTRIRFSGAGLNLDSLHAATREGLIRADGSLGFRGGGQLQVQIEVPFERLDPAAPIWRGRTPTEMLDGDWPPERPVELRLELGLEGGEPRRVRLLDLRPPGGLSAVSGPSSPIR